MGTQINMFHPLTGRKQTQEQIEKRMAPQRGKPKSPKVAAMLRVVNIGRVAHNHIVFTQAMDEQLRNLYLDERLGCVEVGKIMGMSAIPIVRRLRDLDIPRRGLEAGMLGKKASAATRRKMSETQKRIGTNRGLKFSKERREQMSHLAIEALSKHTFYKQGRYYSAKLDKTMWCRSSYEKTMMEMLDADVNVAWYEYEPKGVTIPYEFEGMIHNYKPDFLITYANGDKKLVEVKSTYSVTFERTKAKIEALRSLRKSDPSLPPVEIVVGKGNSMKIERTISV